MNAINCIHVSLKIMYSSDPEHSHSLFSFFLSGNNFVTFNKDNMPHHKLRKKLALNIDPANSEPKLT